MTCTVRWLMTVLYNILTNKTLLFKYVVLKIKFYRVFLMCKYLE